MILKITICIARRRVYIFAKCENYKSSGYLSAALARARNFPISILVSGFLSPSRIHRRCVYKPRDVSRVIIIRSSEPTATVVVRRSRRNRQRRYRFPLIATNSNFARIANVNWPPPFRGISSSYFVSFVSCGFFCLMVIFFRPFFILFFFTQLRTFLE